LTRALPPVTGQDAAQGLRELHRLCVPQIDDMDVAGLAARHIQPRDQAARKPHALGTGRAHQHRVEAGIGKHRHALGGIRLLLLRACACAFIEHPVDGYRHVDGERVNHRDDFNLVRNRGIDRFNDLGEPGHVGRIVGDHQRIVARIGDD